MSGEEKSKKRDDEERYERRSKKSEKKRSKERERDREKEKQRDDHRSKHDKRRTPAEEVRDSSYRHYSSTNRREGDIDRNRDRRKHSHRRSSSSSSDSSSTSRRRRDHSHNKHRHKSNRSRSREARQSSKDERKPADSIKKSDPSFKETTKVKETVSQQIPTFKTEINPIEMAQMRQKLINNQIQATSSNEEVKLPSYYKANAVNAALFAEQQRKRKLLWSKPKDSIEMTSTKLVGQAIVETSQDERTAEKFRKLMGIEKDELASNKSPSTSGSTVTESLNSMQKKAFEDLDKEYEYARMTTHLNRGKGLGFASYPSNSHS